MSIKAILLCAGSSTRFGEDNKLLYELDGQPICVLSLNNLLKSSVDQIIVVTGHQSDQLISSLNKHGNLDPTNARVRVVHNADYGQGMGSSIATAMNHVKDTDAVIVCLGDMPRVNAHVVDALQQAWRDNPEYLAAVPVLNGKRGNPVLLASGLFKRLENLAGDLGAKQILVQVKDLVLELPVHTNAVFQDIDIQSDI